MSQYENEYSEIEIIDDLEEEQEQEHLSLKKKGKPKESCALQKYYQNNEIFEIGVDEVGRGPLFGRVYTAAVILPKDDSFDHSKMKDSKKFHSKKKIEEVSEYIKMHAIAWSINYEDEQMIDNINILQATQQCMHKSIKEIMEKALQKEYMLLIDGNYFKPIIPSNNIKYKFACIEGGDNIYSSIAAASIIAKVERDKYIDQLCIQYPYLIDNYAINNNKGYGSKKHIDGIKMHGITPWHRRTFGICKQY